MAEMLESHFSKPRIVSHVLRSVNKFLFKFGDVLSPNVNFNKIHHSYNINFTLIEYL